MFPLFLEKIVDNVLHSSLKQTDMSCHVLMPEELALSICGVLSSRISAKPFASEVLLKLIHVHAV
jgi:hypothetical protein